MSLNSRMEFTPFSDDDDDANNNEIEEVIADIEADVWKKQNKHIEKGLYSYRPHILSLVSIGFMNILMLMG